MKSFKILYYALKNTKNIYTSLVGEKIKNDILNNKDSEFNKKNWSFIKFCKLCSDLFLIKLPISSPSWIPNCLRLIIFGQNSKYIPNSQEIDNSGNCFIYINGILSNEDVVRSNQKQLELLLKKPINIIHNVTDSLIMDLLECIIGRETEDLTEASTITLYTICTKLLDDNINKIILICHSQGTIIVAKVIRSLKKLGLNKRKYLEKLEIYAFASCASKMNYIMDELPYMEHFANENDFVAKLGCNRPEEISKYISIDGTIFIIKNKSGHMFNSHYINNFKEDYPNSKLINYMPS